MNASVRQLNTTTQRLEDHVKRSRSEAINVVFDYLETAKASDSVARQIMAVIYPLFHHQCVPLVHGRVWPCELKSSLISIIGMYVANNYSQSIYTTLSHYQEKFSYA